VEDPQKANICLRNDVQSAEPEAHIQLQSPLPEGIPAIAARVDGYTIASSELEAATIAMQSAMHSQLATLSTHAPPPVRASLNKSLAQIRQQKLNSMIENRLWLEEGKKNGKLVSLDAVHTYMQNLLTSVHKASPESSAYINFYAYLCANHLSEAGFLSNLDIIRSYQDNMTIQAAQDSYLQSQASDPHIQKENRDMALSQYVLLLRRKAHIQILIPASFLAS
jgi:hypothetical protein